MAEIVASIEISRRPEDVFPYVADPSHHPEWIESVVSVRREDDAPLAVGSRVLATRRVGPRKVRYTEEMVELHPPRTWANRGVGGIPVIAIAKGTVEPLDDGKRSRVTISCELQGHGIGKLLVPLLVRRLAKQLPRDGQKLKEVLERGSLSGGRAPVHHDPAALSRVPDESGRDHEVRDE
jgi:uncharacterized protein YndB with AHSA1/START domain